MARSTQVIRSCYGAHTGLLGLFAYQVLRAGHVRTGPGFRVERKDVPGHEFLYCLGGSGEVTLGGRRHALRPREVAWLPVREPHAHAADPADPWELLWLRVDGPNLRRLATVLAVDEDPVFRPERPEEVEALMEAALAHLEHASLAAQAACDGLVAELIRRLLECRGSRVLTPEVATHSGLGRLMAQIHIHYNEPWDIDRFAAACRVSKSQLFRLFRAAFDETPMGWLRNYRLGQARRLLAETDEPIATVAQRVGYDDPLHFSRDFRKHVGLSPSAFRETEHW